MFYTNKSTPIIAHTCITEWDIRSGNTSMMKHYELIPLSQIEALEKMDKKARVKKVGLLMKRDKNFSKSLEEKFNETIKTFITLNDLQEEDIVAVKRDAIFIRAKRPRFTSIGEHIHFQEKESYQAFLYLNSNEFYLKSNMTFDVKGMPDELLPLHEDGLLEFIKSFLIDYEYDMNGLHAYCKEYVTAYKNRDLPLDAYREFNGVSAFTVIGESGIYQMDTIDEEILPRIDISYNYKTYIIPLIQYLF